MRTQRDSSASGRRHCPTCGKVMVAIWLGVAWGCFGFYCEQDGCSNKNTALRKP